MKQIEILSTKLENQIESMLDTIIAIQEIENTGWPMDHLPDWHQTALSMIFMTVPMRHLWDKFDKWHLSTEQRIELVQEVWSFTYEHFKEVYWFNTRNEI